MTQRAARAIFNVPPAFRSGCDTPRTPQKHDHAKTGIAGNQHHVISLSRVLPEAHGYSALERKEACQCVTR